MAHLVILNDPTGETGKQVFELDNGTCAIDALMRHIPQGLDKDSVDIIINNNKVDLDGEPKELLYSLGERDKLVVVNNPKGVAEVIYAVVIAVVAAVVAVALAPKPKIPNNAGEQKTSPNNELSGQTNLARPYQALPLVLGSPVIYPDLIGEARETYTSEGLKIIEQYFCIGLGTFEIEEIRAGRSEISNFGGSVTELFEPVNKVTTINNYTAPYIVDEVNGQTIKGVNEGSVVIEYELTPSDASTTVYGGSTFVMYVEKTAEADELKSNYDASSGTFDVEASYRFFFIDEPGLPPDSTIGAGSGYIDSMTLLDPGGPNEEYKIVIKDFSGPKSDNDTYYSPFKIGTLVGSQLGPFTMPVESEKLQLNFAYRRGLKGTVTYEIVVYELTSQNGVRTGVSEQFTETITKNTLDEVYKTRVLTIANGTSWYEFTIKRITQSSQKAENPDQAVLEAAYALVEYPTLTLPNVTILKVNTPGVQNATRASASENKINLIATSKLISYDTISRTINYTPQPSRRMADGLLHMYVDYYGLDPATLDIDSLYEIQERLDSINAELGQFDFTFDDLSVGLLERMETTLNVARCYHWQDGDIYRFRRDEKRDFESGIITRLDTVADENRDFSITINKRLNYSYDSVQVQYVDRSVNKKRSIFKRVDALGDVVDGSGINPKKLDLAGCQSFINAENRAILEMRKIQFQNETLTDTCLQSVNLFDRGDMILYEEQFTREDVYGGEILDVDGMVVTLSEPVSLPTGVLWVIYFTLIDGSRVGPYSVLPVAGTDRKVELNEVSGVFLRDSTLGYDIQAGSRYMIAKASDLSKTRWTLTEKRPAQRNTQITMVNYDTRIYDHDEAL